jgi:integration host factor subunit alpha
VAVTLGVTLSLFREVRKKGQRIGRNPKTGTEVPISPRRVMVFKPSAILKQRINGHHHPANGGEAADN